MLYPVEAGYYVPCVPFGKILHLYLSFCKAGLYSGNFLHHLLANAMPHKIFLLRSCLGNEFWAQCRYWGRLILYDRAIWKKFYLQGWRMKYTCGKKNPLLYLVTIKKKSRRQTKLIVFLPKPALLGFLFSKNGIAFSWSASIRQRWARVWHASCLVYLGGANAQVSPGWNPVSNHSLVPVSSPPCNLVASSRCIVGTWQDGLI